MFNELLMFALFIISFTDIIAETILIGGKMRENTEVSLMGWE